MKEPDASSFDVAAMLRDLSAGGLEGVPSWLKASWQSPEPFFQALHAYAGHLWPEPLKSQPYAGQDFYHDLVVRHLHRRSDAFVSAIPGQGWRRLSYAELHTRVTALAAMWEATGVEPGKTVALVLPTSEESVLTLLAALRLGLVVSLLPPRGATFVRNRLTALAPAYVVSHPRHVALLGKGDWSALPLTSRAGASLEPPLRSHTYTPEAPVARLFSPLSPTPDKPVELRAGPLFLGLLRDALLVLALRPEDRVALPDFETLQHQPWALMVTLLAGACFLEADAQALTLEDDQALLAPTVVGLSPALRERLLTGHGRTEGWRLWVRNPAEPYDWDRWEQLNERLSAQPRCWGMNLVANAAFGGSLLLSPAQPRPSPFSVLPTPGQPWQLADIMGGGQPSRTDSGLYAAVGEGAHEASFGRLLLSRTRTGYFFSGSSRLGALGQTYPEREVVQVVESHPDVLGAAVVITPLSPHLNATRVALLVFLTPDEEPTRPSEELRLELEQRIELELGARYRPEMVCFYFLMPRRTKQGEVDAAWCRWQFLSGSLDKKNNDELFRMLSQVRWLLSQTRTGQEDGP